ncbi:MAG TPA: alkaline phosphatase family protein, partial [Thermoanaerobaculia bacterium]|nr:alkaline phosphatase family protein [Thermoanaerobaculia bacterium]
MSAMRGLFLALLLAASIAAPLCAATSAEQPRLIVVISIDQFRYDYLVRFAPWFSERGFNRFLKHGASFDETFYRHATTFTGPGHASIGTGRVPAESGIVGNTWIDRGAPSDEESWDWFFDDTGGYTTPQPVPHIAGMKPWYSAGNNGVPRYCVYDDRTVVSAGTTAGMSPASLAEDSLGDRLKQRFPNAKIVATALKDRAAILMAGRRADAAYWFDYRLPGFVSSSYYRYDPKLFEFNAKVPGYIPASKLWQLSGLIPPADLQRVTFDPPEAWPLKNPRYQPTFDHPITDARSLTYSPYGNDLLLDFTLQVADRAALGADDDPDVLFVGLSTPDYLGHYYGPDSMEVADDAVRLDRSLGRFLDALEQKYGKRLLVAITADHGVQSTPEIAKLRDPKLDAGRIDLRNP